MKRAHCKLFVRNTISRVHGKETRPLCRRPPNKSGLETTGPLHIWNPLACYTLHYYNIQVVNADPYGIDMHLPVPSTDGYHSILRIMLDVAITASLSVSADG